MRGWLTKELTSVQRSAATRCISIPNGAAASRCAEHDDAGRRRPGHYAQALRCASSASLHRPNLAAKSVWLSGPSSAFCSTLLALACYRRACQVLASERRSRSAGQQATNAPARLAVPVPALPALLLAGGQVRALPATLRPLARALSVLSPRRKRRQGGEKTG